MNPNLFAPRSFRVLISPYSPDKPRAGARAHAKFHQGEIGTRARANKSIEQSASCAVRAATMPSNTETPSERAARLLLERE